MQQTRRGRCRLDSGWTRTDEGYLDAKVKPTRAGVFLYMDAAGRTIRELRPPEEVFDAASLASLENKAITNSHPPKLLDAKNTSEYQKGVVFGAHEKAPDGLHTQAGARIYDSDTIRDVLGGKEEVSCGYTCDVIDQAGVHPVYGPYDKVQRNIRYNHLAIEWRGRAGPGARLTTDSADLDSVRFDAVEIEAPGLDNTIKTGDPTVIKTKINGHDVEVSEAAKVAFDAYEQVIEGKIQALQAEIAQHKADTDAIRADRDALKAKADAAPNIEEVIEQRVKARADLLQAVAAISPEVKTDGLTDRQVKEAAIMAQPWAKDHKLDSESDHYVDGLFAAARKMVSAPGSVAAAIDRADSQDEQRDDKKMSAADKARADMLARKANSWKKDKKKMEA